MFICSTVFVEHTNAMTDINLILEPVEETKCTALWCLSSVRGEIHCKIIKCNVQVGVSDMRKK